MIVWYLWAALFNVSLLLYLILDKIQLYTYINTKTTCVSLNRDNRSVFAVWFSSTCFLPAAEPSQSHGCFLFSSPRRASCRLAAETDDCCVFSSSADFLRSLWRETQRCSQTLQLMFNAAGRVGSRQQRPELNPALANMWTSAECCRDGVVMEDATSEEVTSHSVWVSEENSLSC